MVPRINDISTDLDDPPVLEHRAREVGRALPYPERFKEQQRRGYPDLGPLRLPLPPDAAFERAVAVARRMERWTVKSARAHEGILEGTAITRLLRFRDDFVIRLRPDGAGTRVDMRSRSRLGKSDLGANAARIRAYFAALAAA